MVGEQKWGSGSRCPACDKTVYPSEQIFAAGKYWRTDVDIMTDPVLVCRQEGLAQEMYQLCSARLQVGSNHTGMLTD